MPERLSSESILSGKPNKEKVEELEQGRDKLMEAKREYLADVKGALLEVFGEEKLPDVLVTEMVDIRKEITARINSTQYVDNLETFVKEQIAELTLKISTHKNPLAGQTATINKQGKVLITSPEGKSRNLTENEQTLHGSLETYFDTYRMAQNAITFRRNVLDFQDEIAKENRKHQSNFYSKKEKKDDLIERLQNKYIDAGFTEDELQELIKTCNLQKLDSIGIEDIKVLAKIRDIFQKFMQGDKTKYVALSAGMLIPAFIDGYAPMFLSNAFKESKIDMTQVGLYALLSSVAAGSSAFFNKQFKDFLNKNFTKDSGVGQNIASNIAELPASQISSYKMDTIKHRIANGKEGYEEVYRLISFDILPAFVTLGTSAIMLYEKNPVLAGGTVLGTGIMMALNKYVEKTTGWWGKQRKAEKQGENLGHQMQQQLEAHMEIILSGMKDDLADRMEILLIKEQLANSDRQFAEIVRDKINEFYGAVNLIVAGLTTFLAGGSPDKFIAALVYSGNFQQGVSRLMSSERNLLKSFRNIKQMELIFNGYAEEEKDKEKNRLGTSSIKNSDIDLKGVEVSLDDQKILEVPNLHIPEGTMVNLNGASGAGKTTLMKVISGYYKPTTGQVDFGHTSMDSIKKSGEDSIYAAISYLPQFPYILEDSVKRNITFGLKSEIDDGQVKGVLKEVGLGERFKNINEPLKGGRGDMGTTSGGETSRIGLARVLLKIRNTNSRIVFLDEPTASVDDKTKYTIANIINREKQSRPNVTFIVISHDKDFVSKLNCDIEVKMEKGKVEQIA